MPMLVKDLYTTALELQRDVLALNFYDPVIKANVKNEEEAIDLFDEDEEDKWSNLPIRQTVINWLDIKNIDWEPCVACGPGWMGGWYQGDIDIPYDTSLTTYQDLEAYLENPDGSMRLPGVGFYYLPLELAIERYPTYKPGTVDDF